MRRRQFGRVAGGVLLAGIMGSGALAAWAWHDLPFPPIVRPPAASIVLTDRNGQPLYEVETASGRHRPVALDQVAPAVVHATVATEDASFFTNPGVDGLALLRALLQTLRGEPAGGSTITMQLARLSVLPPERLADAPMRRKLQEIALALLLTARESKATILAQYLNAVPYGNRAVGIEAASQAYFGKPAANLSLAEAALLAGLPQAPAWLDPAVHREAARERQRQVLALMVRHGWITPAEAAAAAEQPLDLRPPTVTIQAPHFVLGTLSRAVELARATGGERVVTTIDGGLQQLAEAVIRSHLSRLAAQRVTNAALVALDPQTGEVLTLAGSADYFNPAIAGQVNVALAPRQPGSAIKPLTYAAAFERGFSPADVLADVRTVFTTRRGERYVPVNYDHQYHGPLSLRTALASSINSVAVRLLDRIGVGALIDLGQQLGLSTWRDIERYDLALTLGGGEVTLLDLTAAYAAFAAGGEYHPPQDLLRLETAMGRTVWQAAPPPARRVLSPETAFLISHILSDPVARELGFGTGGPLRLSRPAAVKTGTTSSFRDNWTIGYTPDLVVGVWVGNSDGEPMREVSGITGAAPIWHDFFEQVLATRPSRSFPVPETIRWVAVCEVDGKLATPDCPRVVVEPFVAGREPRESSTSYQRLLIDRASGDLWEPGCPGPAVERLFWLLPPDALAWGRERGIPEPPRRSCRGTLRNDPDAPFVRLLEPDEGAVLVLSPRLPREMQRLRVQALGAGGTVQLSVDGQPIASRDGSGWWTLEPGEHRVRAVLVRDQRELAEERRTILVVPSPAEGERACVAC
ncbi:MAG: penicillin-binding protein 1C [Chloroflexi bacterium]|nr:penicillin-binding protein 1C [Chloroflexota bacterium]